MLVHFTNRKNAPLLFSTRPGTRPRLQFHHSPPREIRDSATRSHARGRVIRHLTVIAWLNANSGAVTAIVTAVYAFFTILLWWATRRQAWLSNQLATAAGIQAEAAKAQAGSNRPSFEAAT